MIRSIMGSGYRGIDHSHRLPPSESPLPTSHRDDGGQGLRAMAEGVISLRAEMGRVPIHLVVAARDPTSTPATSAPCSAISPSCGRLSSNSPTGTVVDGEIVVVVDGVTDFDALQQRIHPAESRIKLLSEATPAELVAFDLLADRGDDLRNEPFTERRERLVAACRGAWRTRGISPRRPTPRRSPNYGSTSSSRRAATASSPRCPTSPTNTGSEP